MNYKPERIRYFITIAFILIMACIYSIIPVRASETSETISVDEVRLEGELIHIKVTDTATGIEQELEFNLRDYEDGSEYISVNAIDRNGNQSNVVQFKNPFYVPPSETETPTASPDITVTPEQSESSIPDNAGGVNLRPFTPDGTGTVVDDVFDGDGKEFFSIQTEDGNVFYLIVDRHRSSDNVYLLNAVTENDLMSLAKEGDGLPGSTSSAIPTTAPNPPPASATETTETPSATEQGEPAPKPEKSGNNTANYIIIGVIALAFGAAAYYFKIVRPKQQSGNTDNFGEESEETDDSDPPENPDWDSEFESMVDEDENDDSEGDDEN